MTSDENYSVFRECLSSVIVARSEGQPKTSKRRGKAKRNERKDARSSETIITHERADPEELAEFIDVNIFNTGYWKFYEAKLIFFSSS